MRINELAKSLNIVTGKSYLIINQSKDGMPDAVLDIIEKGGLELAGTIPEDNTIYEYDLNGRPTVEMPEESPAVKAAFEILEKFVK